MLSLFTRRETEPVIKQPRVIFSTAGELRGLAWSPDGRWLLIGLPEADQWVFVRAAGRKISAVSSQTNPFFSAGQ